jgi:hypothetical protein
VYRFESYSLEYYNEGSLNTHNRHLSTEILL